MGRWFFLLLSLICSVNFLGAQCTDGLFHVWPENEVITQSPFIILTATNEQNQLPLSIEKNGKAWLQSGYKRVPLALKEVKHGDNGTVQAVLKPEVLLDPGREYSLHIDTTGKSSFFDKKSIPMKTWVVSYQVDVTRPEWKKRPIEKGKTSKEINGKKEEFIHYEYAAYDISEFALRIKVINKTTSRETQFYVFPGKNVFSIGGDICSGPFVFNWENDYEMIPDLVDASGNIFSWDTDPVRISRSAFEEVPASLEEISVYTGEDLIEALKKNNRRILVKSNVLKLPVSNLDSWIDSKEQIVIEGAKNGTRVVNKEGKPLVLRVAGTKNLTMKNVDLGAIQIISSSNFTLENCNFDHGSMGLEIVASDDIHFINCEISGINSDQSLITILKSGNIVFHSCNINGNSTALTKIIATNESGIQEERKFRPDLAMFSTNESGLIMFIECEFLNNKYAYISDHLSNNPFKFMKCFFWENEFVMREMKQ